MKHWAQMEERGIIWGMQALLKVYLMFGRKILQVFLYPVVCYYWLINAKARQASVKYLQRVSVYLPDRSIRTGLYGSFLHFICFANAIIDKLAAWSGAITLGDVEYHGREAIQRLVERGQGVLVLGSHMGNMEVCRVIAYLGNRVTVNVLVHTKHAEKFNTLLNRYAEAGRMNLIQVTEINAATAMLLQDKIEAGELVVIAADRTPVTGQSRVSRADFLGHSALFPQGPYILAALLKCPVYTLFCLKQHGKQVIFFEHFSDGLLVPRKQRDTRLQRCVQDYARRLQEYCLKEPLQWFNFYDFWQDEDD
ncbi:MAG: LpxL/LpxP family acyltransferase [Gammaproteobacteria bacterium]